jgi:hypothetical protein
MPNWHDIFVEIQTQQAQAINATNLVRRKYLTALHEHTKRNVIAYYSGWLSKGSIQLSDINDEDKNGFMTTIHKLDTRQEKEGKNGYEGPFKLSKEQISRQAF